MTRLLFFIILIFYLTISRPGLNAQQNPSGINWKSIDTGTYEIIFPEEITPLGQRVANLMVHYEKYNYHNFKTIPRRIPLVLINQYSEPNGFVSFAPFYSHWFTTPSSFNSIEWYKGLAIHEGRHMAQVNRLKEGAGKKTWRILLGESGTAAFSVLYIPAWFFEGDAVVMETALTKGGRGRTPYFDLWQRGLELEGKRYSYYESYLGSYDSLYPYSDHYRLGYILCSYIEKHYGEKIWERVLSRTGRFFLWYSFDSSLKHETGKSMRELYDAALDEYRDLWTKQHNGLKITDTEIIIPEKKETWESYLLPSAAPDGNLTAVMFSGEKKISLVRFSNNKIENIKQLPYEVVSNCLMNEKVLTTGGNFALWRENIPDMRWGYKSFSDLKLLDLNNGSTRFITDKQRFIASTISNDGELAAGIEFGTDLKYYLKVIDTVSGKEILTDEIKDKGYLFDPSISPDKERIAVAALSEKGNSILLYSLITKKTDPLIENSFDERFRSPVFYKNYVIYGSDFSGIDNIYAIDIKTKKRYQVTSRPLGAYFPSVSNDTLYFNDYSIYGYHAASIKLDEKKWIPLEQVDRRVINYIGSIHDQKIIDINEDIDLIPDNEYKVDDYTPILNSINFYGWMPVFNSTSTNFYVSLLSQDVLQTTEIMLSYVHNFNENKNLGLASLVYSGLFPVIAVDGGYGGRAVYLKDESTDTDPVYLTWEEVTGSGKISIPLNFSRGIHSIQIEFGSEAGYIKIYDRNRDDYSSYDYMNEDGDLRYMRYFLSFTHMIRGAMNSVTPGIGEVLNTSFVNTPYNGDYRGSLYSAELALYLPGLTDTQGSKISGSYEKINYRNYIFPQQILFSRGYDAVRYENFFKCSAEYAFPILNFSTNIWKLIYFKRLNGNIFYDFGAGKSDKRYTYYRSAGLELTTLQNIFSNIYLSVEAGLRYSRCFDSKNDSRYNTDKNRYELVIKTPL